MNPIRHHPLRRGVPAADPEPGDSFVPLAESPGPCGGRAFVPPASHRAGRSKPVPLCLNSCLNSCPNELTMDSKPSASRPPLAAEHRVLTELDEVRLRRLRERQPLPEPLASALATVL